MRILLVEDEEKVARLVKRGLKEEGFNVDVASDGRFALQHLDHYLYDLVILDLNLPNIPGKEVLKSIRTGKRSLPVLILTARDALADKVVHFDLGADDYLTKPFSFTELVLRVRALLRRGAPAGSNDTLQVADLVLDRPAHTVKRGDETLAMSAKEFALLAYLMENKERVLSRTMIVENVWDHSFEGLTNIVDVYIRLLRKKIDDGRNRKLIRTVRGVGYGIGEHAG
jgi:two-component system copper resistance phosphate regulon response regulator CusR